MATTDLPSGAEHMPPAPSSFEAAVIADPYPFLALVREQGNGVWQEPRLGTHFVTRHDDVDALLRDHSLSRDPRDHTRLRSLVSRAFTPRAVEAMRPRAQQIADQLLDAVADQPRWDLMAALAAPFPTIVIAEMLGVDPTRQAWFKECSDKFVRTLDPFISQEELEVADAARRELDAYFMEVIAQRRAEPRADLITGLVQAQEEGDRLTDLEMVTFCELLLTAGNVTTTDLIGNGVYALLTHPGELKKLQEDPGLVERAVEEMLRYDRR